MQSMNRPSMDTQHVPEDEKALTDAVAEAPTPGRLWVSQLMAVILLAVAVYAVCRAGVEYPSTADEAQQLRTTLGQADISLTHLGNSGADWGQSVRTWRDKTAERYGVVRLHLRGLYGLLALAPLALVFAALVWWRGQFPRLAGKFPLDRVQIAMNASALVLLAGLRIFDAATLSVMARTPAVPDLQTFLKTPTQDQKAKRLADLRGTLEKTLKQIQDKKSTPQSRAVAARLISAAAWDRQFVTTLSQADKVAFQASLKELVKKTYTEDDSCPVIIRAISGFGDDEAADALETEREKSRPTWVDVKKPEAVLCLFRAIAAGRDADVRKLLERGVNVNVVSPAERHTALHEAVSRRQLKVAELLLEKGAKVQINGESGAPGGTGIEKEFPLHRAVGDVRLVRLLLDKGADPNVLNYRGMTPLHVAAAAGETESAELLLARKAKLNAVDFGKRTPLDVVGTAPEATKQQAATMRKVLIERGALTAGQLAPKNSAEAAIAPNAR
jgi:hypothetical protein